MSQFNEEKDNFETKVSIDNDDHNVREVAFIKSEAKKNTYKEIKDKIRFLRSINSRQYSSKNLLVCDNDTTTKKEIYRIAISKSGEFVATFDTGKIFHSLLTVTEK
jgi:hypothetical protein